MADRKLHLPDDLLSSKSSDHSSNPKVEGSASDEEKVHVGLHDEPKDQPSSESSIPLSPQWLYSKPNETKMDMRSLSSTSLGNTNDMGQKEGWRLDGTDEKKDWRRTAPENESSHRWREEERETGLLGPRRDRRKSERRVEPVSVRETMENRVLPSSDRWHDGSNRNSGHETRRDNKWTSRWGPDGKEKESRAERKADVEKEKEDAHIDNQSSIASNRPLSGESDSRDKWRPRHRMEIHSAGSNSYRAAPGFGVERGRGEASKPGFAVGRGRSNAIGRGSSAGSTTGSQSYKWGSIIGKQNCATDTFFYPRGKLLDIYRLQKLDSSFSAMPKEMDECLPLTQDDVIEPLAFVAPDAEEEAILTDIWKGKITSSGVTYNSVRKGQPAENVSGVGEYESNDRKVGILPSVLSEDIADPFRDIGNDVTHQTDYDHSLWDNNSRLNALDGEEVDHGERNKIASEGVTTTAFESDDVWNTKEISTYLRSDSQLDSYGNEQMMASALTRHIHSNDVDSASSFDFQSKLTDDSNSLFVVPSFDQDGSSSTSLLEGRSELKDLKKGIPPEDMYFYYIDPHGTTQGPFLGADILMWFEQGYFGTDLPVRLADSPEGTPFQSLGEVIPGLKLKTGHSSSGPEQLGGFNEKFDSELPVASNPKSADSSTLNELCQPFNSHSVQQAQSRMSDPEKPLQLPHTEGQSFDDFVSPDEEIVFPGRPESRGYPATKSSWNALDSLTNSNGFPSLSNDLTEVIEPVLPSQGDNKLHPFGLLWSELEASQTRQTESSDLSSLMGRSAPFGATSDRASVAEKWTDIYRQDVLSAPNSIQDATAAHRMSLAQQEPSHFDLAEQLMSSTFQQQQLQQRNKPSPHSLLNESLLEHVPGENFMHHQQLANRSVSDLEHLLALQQLQQQQLQQQQQQQLQQQQLQQRQLQLQQQFHQQQKLLQERQQSQARQVLLHGQIPDPGISQARVDPLRTNVLDQVLLEQQLLHELQQWSHHPQRHLIPSAEQLIQAKLSQKLQQDQQRDLYELLSRGQHGQMQSLEHQILQEQVQARQLSMGLRQRMNMEEKRHADSVWPVNENDYFVGGVAGNPRSHSSGISPLDFYQRQQRIPHDDQLGHFERNLSFKDRLRQGIYEHGSLTFERSLSLPSGPSAMNMETVNAMAHAHGLDIPEMNTRLQSAGQVGPLSSGSHPHNSHHTVVPKQFHVQLDPMENHWPENSGSLANDWMDARMQQLHINAERQKRETDAKITSQDSSFWMKDGSNDDQSRRLLMELLHQKSGHQSVDSQQLSDELSFDKKMPSGLYSGSSSSDCHLSVIKDQEASMNNSSRMGSYGSNACELAEVYSAGEQVSHLGNTDQLSFKSESAATSEELLGVSAMPQVVLKDSNFVDKLSINHGYLDVDGRKHGSKSHGMTRDPVSEIQNVITEQAHTAATDLREVTAKAIPLSRNCSLNDTGFYDNNVGPKTSFSENVSINQVPVVSRGPESILLRRPPVARSSASQEGLSELVSDTVVRAKISSSSDGANQVNQATDLTPGKKDVRFRRTSSCGDADASEPSFIDMLKSNNAKKTAAAAAPEVHMAGAVSESSDAAQGGRSGKKKGKKGRQIDPALLGFKVTSNRIMMGEIQRIED